MTWKPAPNLSTSTRSAASSSSTATACTATACACSAASTTRPTPPQDTFTNLARRGVGAARDDDALRFYLFSTARNACFDLQRRRRADASLDALRDAGADLDRAPLEPRSEPEQRALDNAARAAVFGALATVPERQRTAFVLRELGGLTHDELAEQLGMNANAVAQLLHRARRALQVALPAAAY